MREFVVKKILNNNVLIAMDGHHEVVLIGRGIGFNRKADDSIPEEATEKVFILHDPKEQENYLKLLDGMDDRTLQAIIAAIGIIKKRSKSIINENAHVILTDHIAFAIRRLLNGLEIRNPFLAETRALYPAEYEVAEEMVEYLNQALEVDLPEGEIGFIALHVHSAITAKKVSELQQYSQLVLKLVGVIENQFHIKIDKESIDYIRLVRHLRYTVERVLGEEKLNEPEKIANLLKMEYPECYNLSWKLIKIMQHTLKKPVYDAEAVYLTMHLQRFHDKIS